MGGGKKKKSKTVLQGNYPEESGHQQMHAAKPAQREQLYLQAFSSHVALAQNAVSVYW